MPSLEKIKKNDWDATSATPYHKICEKCGKKLELLTQENEHAEYYTTVFVKCKCSNYVRFHLPVN